MWCFLHGSSLKCNYDLIFIYTAMKVWYGVKCNYHLMFLYNKSMIWSHGCTASSIVVQNCILFCRTRKLFSILKNKIVWYRTTLNLLTLFLNGQSHYWLSKVLNVKTAPNLKRHSCNWSNCNQPMFPETQNNVGIMFAVQHFKLQIFIREQ